MHFRYYSKRSETEKHNSINISFCKHALIGGKWRDLLHDSYTFFMLQTKTASVRVNFWRAPSDRKSKNQHFMYWWHVRISKSLRNRAVWSFVNMDKKWKCWILLKNSKSETPKISFEFFIKLQGPVSLWVLKLWQ